MPVGVRRLGAFFRLFAPDPPPVLTRELPRITEERLQAVGLDILREAVRFAEEGIKSQLASIEILERKSVLLGTLCAVMLGFLLSRALDFSQWGLLGLVAFLSLLAAVLFCARAINFSLTREHAGFSPAVMSNFFSQPRDGDEKKVLYTALSEYEGRAGRNQLYFAAKYRDLHYGRSLWVAGTGAFLGMAAGEYQAAAGVCGWLLG